MTNEDFVQYYAQYNNMYKKDARIEIKRFIETYKNGLKEGREIEIKGFGKLYVKMPALRKLYNFKDGKVLMTKKKPKIRFDPYGSFCNYVFCDYTDYDVDYMYDLENSNDDDDDYQLME